MCIDCKDFLENRQSQQEDSQLINSGKKIRYLIKNKHKHQERKEKREREALRLEIFAEVSDLELK